MAGSVFVVIPHLSGLKDRHIWPSLSTCVIVIRESPGWHGRHARSSSRTFWPDRIRQLLFRPGGALVKAILGKIIISTSAARLLRSLKIANMLVINSFFYCCRAKVARDQASASSGRGRARVLAPGGRQLPYLTEKPP